MTDTLTIGVYRTHAEGAIQIQITQTNQNGTGTGYRIAGPKHHNMGVSTLLEHELNARDAAEIRAYLDAVFPVPVLAALPPAADRAALAEEPETEEQRADREETERNHAAGSHQYCGVTCEVEFPTEMLRNGILAKGYPGTAGMLDELLRRAAAEAPTTTRPETGSCVHCGKPVRCITGTLAEWWVHTPYGNTACNPEHAADSPRATPKPTTGAPTTTKPELCGRTESVDGGTYPPCARPVGHEETYCRSTDGGTYFLAAGVGQDGAQQ